MEYIDIFDQNNNPTGEIKEKTQAHEDGNFHRTALFEFYLETLEYRKRPEFLNKYLETPCLIRLKK